MPKPKKRSGLQTLTLATLFSCLTLVFVGATVRATGSGLGCPDWPKCFGRWLPPLHVRQLPPDYQKRFSIQGQKLAPFSAVKTWTEYVNRLMGMVVGFQVLLMAFLGWRGRRPGTKLRGILLLFVLGQGFLGSLVVSSHLAPSVITFHLLAAVAILLLLTELSFFTRERPPAPCPHPPLKKVYGLSLGLALIQLLLGAGLRRKIDPFIHETAFLPRSLWYDSLEGSVVFDLHRLLALGLTIFFLVQVFRHRKGIRGPSKHLGLWTISLLALQFAFQFLLAMAFKYLHFPLWSTPIHLLTGCLIICSLFFGLRLHGSSHKTQRI
ncbi:MAG: COX15/CtaA family protein [Bacteriovoracales bacterium]|nr:COX15/CtaA family protein [Bacteriovoracales bacterium]